MARKGSCTTADYLPLPEYNRLVESLHKDQLYIWELFCRLAFCCAYRCSDVLSLQWHEIVDKNGLVRLEKKTKKIRSIPFNNSVRKKISELYFILGKPDISLPVICNNKTNKPYTIKHINELLKVFRVKYHLKIKNFSTHTFRKTFGRMVYEESNRSAESLILLNSIFRHSSIEITKAYIGLTQDEINSVFESIDF